MMPILFMHIKKPHAAAAWGYSFEIRALLNDHITIAPRRDCVAMRSRVADHPAQGEKHVTTLAAKRRPRQAVEGKQALRIRWRAAAHGAMIA
jgi:hypothetical protein